LGTTSLKSSKTMRPAGLPSIVQSKKTFGFPAAAAAAKGLAHPTVPHTFWSRRAHRRSQMMRECTAALTKAAHKRTCRSQERGASIAAVPEAVARGLRMCRHR
jgi:hypothetical protein